MDVMDANDRLRKHGFYAVFQDDGGLSVRTFDGTAAVYYASTFVETAFPGHRLNVFARLLAPGRGEIKIGDDLIEVAAEPHLPPVA
jgi:hypothetical protein